MSIVNATVVAKHYDLHRDSVFSTNGSFGRDRREGTTIYDTLRTSDDPAVLKNTTATQNTVNAVAFLLRPSIPKGPPVLVNFGTGSNFGAEVAKRHDRARKCLFFFKAKKRQEMKHKNPAAGYLAPCLAPPTLPDHTRIDDDGPTCSDEEKGTKRMRSASTTPRSVRGTDPDEYDRVMGVTSVGSAKR